MTVKLQIRSPEGKQEISFSLVTSIGFEKDVTADDGGQQLFREKCNVMESWTAC